MRRFRVGTFLVVAVVASVIATASVGAQNTAICMGLEATIVGTAGDDSINGTTGPDVIFAAQGDDFINGRGGDDVICAGKGDDIVVGGDGFDILFGAQGDDKMFSADFASASAIADNPDFRDDTAGARMFGGAGNDDMYGSNRWDRMQGGPGEDQLYGFEGRDWLRGGPDRDFVNGGPGIDDVHGGNGIDRLTVTRGDSVRGGNGADWCVITGQAERLVSCGQNRFEAGVPQQTLAAGDYAVPRQATYGFWRTSSYYEVNGPDDRIITNDFVADNGPTVAIVNRGGTVLETRRTATRVEAAGPVNMIGRPGGRALIGLDIAPGRYQAVPVGGNSVFLQLRDARGFLLETVSGDTTQVLNVPADAVFLDWEGTLQRAN